MTEIVTIEAIGHRGDGLAAAGGEPLYVPFALPGETVRVERTGERGRIVEIVEASDERVTPPCRHFGTCGGCALQMMPLEASHRLKRSFVADALAQQGLDVPVEETRATPAAGRRRTVFSAISAGARPLFGYSERLSNRIVDIGECPILVPELQARLAGLRRLITLLLPKKGAIRASVLLTESGLDIAVADAPFPSAAGIAEIAEIGQAIGLAQLSVGGEIVLAQAMPMLHVDGAPVSPPSGAFVQASRRAEAIMTELAVSHLDGSKAVLDLFAGIGTFSIPLARHAPVHAVEGDADALDALAAGARGAKGIKPVTGERRDLFRFPLSAQELGSYDGALFDPPRAGARAQATAMSQSGLKRIVGVSCNPGTFARDARILVDGGFRLERVVPVDQFVWSAATEVVGLFTRD